MPKITTERVNKLKPGEIIWDTEIRGLGVRCRALQSGTSKTFVLKKSISGRQRWITLGVFGSPLTVASARTKATKVLGDIANGVDVATVRDADRENPTVEKCVEVFLDEFVKPKRKEATHRQYKDVLKRLVVPEIGSIKVKDVDTHDIEKIHAKWKDSPYQSNRMLAVLSKMMSWAEAKPRNWRPLDSNPCKGIERYPEAKRQRFLSDDELKKLGAALTKAESTPVKGLKKDQCENPYVIAAFRVLLLSGMRLGEVRNLRWKDVNFDQSMIYLPDSKTGQKEVFLSAPVKQVLNDLKRIKGVPWVFPNPSTCKPIVNYSKPWKRVCKLAEITDARRHDLRHTVASHAAAGGASLKVIGALLGHSSQQTTERYAHLVDDPVKKANEAVAKKIEAALGGTEAEVIDLNQERRG